MKVLKLTPFFHHPDVDSWPAAYDSVGGMQIQTWRQAVWLAQEGIHQHVMTIGFPGLPKLRQLQPFQWIERMLLPMPQIRSEFSGLLGLTQSWALATLTALLLKGRKHDFDVIHDILANRLIQRHCLQLFDGNHHSFLSFSSRTRR